MRSVVVSVLVFVFLLTVPAPSRAGGRTGRGVAETLARAQDECCPARNHGQYVSCAAHVCNDAIKKHVLQPSSKVIILKHGCDEQTTTTTTVPPTTTSTTEHPPTSTTEQTTTTTTSTTTETEPSTTTTCRDHGTTSTTTPTEPTTTTVPTTTSTTEHSKASTTTTTSIPEKKPATTSTTLPGPREICGNCIDDDGNGLTDFEDPACCSQAQTFTMTLSHGRLRPVGGLSRLRLKSLLARAGLAQVNPMKQDVFLQIRPAGGGEMLCAKMPADKFMPMHGAIKFWDRKHAVASAKGIDDLTIKIRRDGSVRFRTLGRRVQMQTPPHGLLQVTVGFHDRTGDAGNRCSTTVEAFRSGRSGALVTP